MRKRFVFFMVGVILVCGIIAAPSEFNQIGYAESENQNYMTFQWVEFSIWNPPIITGNAYINLYDQWIENGEWRTQSQIAVLNPWTFKVGNKFNSDWSFSYIAELDKGDKLLIRTDYFDSITGDMNESICLIDSKNGEIYKKLDVEQGIKIRQFVYNSMSGNAFCIVSTVNAKRKLLKIRDSDLEITGKYDLGNSVYVGSRMAISPDGNTITVSRKSSDEVEASANNTCLDIYNAGDFSLLRSITVETDIRRICAASNNRLLVWLSNREKTISKLQIFDMESGNLIHSIDAPGLMPLGLEEVGDGKIYCLAYKGENKGTKYRIFILDPSDFSVEVKNIDLRKPLKNKLISASRYSERLAVKNGKLRFFYVEMRKYFWEEIYWDYYPGRDRLYYIDVE
jgi:hypothetical protein